ncbi:nucleolar transcription factor 1-B-like isoform X2 [Contarinia nasturtii]|uniref:nucleolar transcription factor 1-B-like isoform X2 n=1 Tax=Contarinia nasturtii TaxID=265458 RepID=UPI0012D46DA1|nr:nucleolar transcription factor 1-B-like isoform X2 [Contarinia nasturtii]
MEEQKSPNKTLKKKRVKSNSQVVDTDDTDNELPDYNGVDSTLHINDDSFSSDGGWSSDDDRKLVQKVKSTSKQSDKVSYKTRLKQLDWNEIAFKSYSAKDCENRFQNHLKHVRRHRNLNEIVTDIETNIKKCPIKKPLNSYQLFIQDQLTHVKSSGDFSETMKNLSSLYKELSPEERSSYERKAEQLRLEYKQKKEDFKSGNISKAASTPVTKAKTPFMLYAESKKSEEIDYSTLRESYTNMALDEKYKWVIKAVSEAQDGSENVSKILNKEEQRIFKGQIKSTPSAYSLYVKETYNKIKGRMEEPQDSKNIFTEIALQWKSLDPKKKKIYTNAAILLKEKAAKEQEAFNVRHGVTPQKVKRRKSTFVERPPEDDDDLDDEEATVQPKVKRQKTSNANHSDSEETKPKHIQIKLNFKRSSPKPSSVKKSIVTPSPVKEIKLGQSPVKESPVKESPVKESPVKESPVKEEKKKKKKATSESSEYNEPSGSDAASSTISSSSKKKSKKERKSIVEPPGEKPPSDIITYFAKKYNIGKARKAQKAYDKLPKKERKQIKAEYNEITESYVARLKNYLESIPKNEAVAYVDCKS